VAHFGEFSGIPAIEGGQSVGERGVHLKSRQLEW